MNSTNTMSVGRALGVLRKRWYLVLAAVLVAGLGAYLASSAITPVFHSTASLYFSLRTGSSGSDINQGSAYTQNQMLSFARLATSSVVLEPVADELEPRLTETQLRRMMTVTIPQNTVILDIRVGSIDPERAAVVANAVASSLIDVVDVLAPADAEGGSTVTARTIQPATPAIFQSYPNKQQNTALGGIAGFLLAAVILVLASFLDTRVRSESALKQITELPLLGAIEQSPTSADSRPVTIRQSNGSAAESFRQLRAGLRFASASHTTRSLAVTSSVPGEGKTWLTANLAVVLAETGRRVLVIDADLRKPRIADAFGLIRTVGLTTILVDGLPLGEVVQAWPGSSLDILASGAVPPNPAELLASPRMKELVHEAVERYDLVVIDTAPILVVADAAVIAQQADSTLLVADTTHVRRAQVEASIEVLERSGAHIGGVVLNRVKPRPRDSYYRDLAAEVPVRGGLRRRAQVSSPAVERGSP